MTTLTTNTTLTQSLVNSYTWPVSINANVTITLGENIIFNILDHYFIIEGNNIVFNGNNNTITINGVIGYYGVFSPTISMIGLQPSSYIQNTTIKNLGVLTSNNSTLDNLGGWICQGNFGFSNLNISIINCYSTGEIGGMNSGGIVGYNCAYGGTLNIENCFTTGNITGKYAGGIIGSDCCSSLNSQSNTTNKAVVAFGGNGNDDEGT